MKYFSLMLVALSLAACTTEDGKRTLIGNTFCSMRENACKAQCGTLQAQDAVRCRNSCEDSARDKCG
ncbi:MAG: hypothetical protein JNM81_10415 [Rhodospirillaceae bacterium]|nr:hypothetical protein [Rhodospirillaceae bacterium]